MSVIHNLVTKKGPVGRKLRDMLRGRPSHDAIDSGLGPVEYAHEPFNVTKAAGKRGSFMRRIIGYTRTGPFHRQTGVRWLHGEAWPLMQTYFIHTFTHATKGKRKYVGGSVMRMPMPRQLPPYPQRFFGKNQHFVAAY